MLKRTIVLLFLLLPSTIYSQLAEENIQPKENRIGRIDIQLFQSDISSVSYVDPAYLSLYIYLDFFLPIHSYQYMSPQERSLITKNIINSVFKNRQINIKINNYMNNNPLMLISKFIKKDNTLYLVLACNYDPIKQLFTPDFNSNSFAKLYQINNNLPVYETYIYNSDYEKTLKKSKSYLALADLYLFDGDIKNNKNIPKLIKKGLRKSKNEKTTTALRCTLLQYNILNKKNDDIKSLIKILNKNITLKEFLQACDEVNSLIKTFIFQK